MLIGIPVFENVETLDVSGPYDMFRWAGFDVELTAAKPGLVTFYKGYKFQVDVAFADAAQHYHALWVPGGETKSVSREINDPKQTYLNFVKAKAKNAGVIASVCEGSLLLAAAGLLDGYTATTHWSCINCFKERFPKVTAAQGFPRYVLDERPGSSPRLTGGGISSGLDAALKLIEILSDKQTAQKVQINTQYYPDPPVTSKIPEPLPQCGLS
ncbi:MAG: DJ-1/PfpI family protein [Azospirillaceae bacterium]|nr:DJ-1/PfpI family protein [Azospirillaceae bacterium]